MDLHVSLRLASPSFQASQPAHGLLSVLQHPDQSWILLHYPHKNGLHSGPRWDEFWVVDVGEAVQGLWEEVIPQQPPSGSQWYDFWVEGMGQDAFVFHEEDLFPGLHWGHQGDDLLVV